MSFPHPLTCYVVQLSHKNPYARARAAGALGEFGKEALCMAPALLITQRFDPVLDVREQATRALYLIDPQQSCLQFRIR